MSEVQSAMEKNENMDFENPEVSGTNEGMEKKLCSGCGTELRAEARFCPKCGMRVSQFAEEDRLGDNKGEAGERENWSDLQESQAEKDVKQKGGLFSKIWNHPVFTMIAVKFGDILTAVLGVIALIFSILLFAEGGFSGILWGILFLIFGISCVLEGIIRFFSRYRKPEGDEAGKELTKKKRNLCIGVVVIVIGLWGLNRTGGGIYTDVRSITFDNIGPETIGEIVDANVRGAEWSKEKVDGSSWRVYVEGYCPLYNEDIRVGFFYDKLDDGYREVSLLSIEFPESGEYFDNLFSAGVIWASFYD